MPDFLRDYECRCRLPEIMKERGLMQKDAAALTGLHLNVVQRLATGATTRIDFDTILRLCMGLRISPNDLFEIDARSSNVSADINEKNALHDN